MLDFAVPQQVAELMATFEKPWGICGGWAIDLYLETVTREHDDIEIAVFREDQMTLQTYLHDWHLTKVVSLTGQRDQWQEGEYLQLPIHEIHAQRNDGVLCHLEILLNESSEDYWQFRRDVHITRPLSMIWRCSDDGIPYMSPEIVLLYKAKKPNVNDQADFAHICSVLPAEPRRWLEHALATCYPGHQWLDIL